MLDIPGDMNTSGGLPTSKSSANLRNESFNRRKSPNSYGRKKKEIGKKAPAAKRYIVYHATIQGPKDLHIDMRRKTRAGRSPHWHMVLGCRPSLNSNKFHGGGNSETAFKTAKPGRNFQKKQKYK